jgi:hypothetical protein
MAYTTHKCDLAKAQEIKRTFPVTLHKWVRHLQGTEALLLNGGVVILWPSVGVLSCIGAAQNALKAALLPGMMLILISL